MVIEKGTQTAIVVPNPKVQLQTPPSKPNSPTTITAAPGCGLTAPMNLLYINLGKDGESATSQAVRMVGINPVDKTMDIISYPCDLWVSTPSLVSDYTISAIRLCSLIQLIKNTPGKNAGENDIANAVQTALDDTFQVKSDQYLITTTDSLVKAVDQLNGINYLSAESAMITGINLQKGSNQVGSSVVFPLFSASSMDASPWDLINRQNNVLSGIEQKFVSVSTVTLADLIKQSNAESSISGSNLTSLECTLKNIPADQIKFSDIIKGNTTNAQDGSITITNLANILTEMKRIFKQSQPDAAALTPAVSSSATAVTTQPPPPAIPATQAPQPQATQPPAKTQQPPQQPPPTPAQPSSGTLDGQTLVNDRCTQCHGLGSVQRKHTADEWQTIVADMINRGAQLNTDEHATILMYLSSTYGK